MKDIEIDNYGNEFCRYSYYGRNILRCSYKGREGCKCISRENCLQFTYCDLEIQKKLKPIRRLIEYCDLEID